MALLARSALVKQLLSYNSPNFILSTVIHQMSDDVSLSGPLDTKFREELDIPDTVYTLVRIFNGTHPTDSA